MSDHHHSTTDQEKTAHASHAHNHEHSHGGGTDQKRIGQAFLIIFAFMLIEAAGGIASRSLALLADAGHMVSDAIALGMSWVAIEISTRPADPARSYGYKRAQILAAFVNGCTLIAITSWILYEAVTRFSHPVAVQGKLMLGVAVAGVLSNIWAFFILNCGSRENLNMRSAWLHVLGDLLGFFVAIVASIVIILTGWSPIDPILSILVAAIILKSALEILRSSTHILLEGTPLGLDLRVMEEDLKNSVASVSDIHHLHAWSLNNEETLLTLHARCREGVKASIAMTDLKTRIRERFGITHVTIQIDETECIDTTHADMSDNH